MRRRTCSSPIDGNDPDRSLCLDWSRSHQIFPQLARWVVRPGKRKAEGKTPSGRREREMSARFCPSRIKRPTWPALLIIFHMRLRWNHNRTTRESSQVRFTHFHLKILLKTWKNKLHVTSLHLYPFVFEICTLSVCAATDPNNQTSCLPRSIVYVTGLHLQKEGEGRRPRIFSCGAAHPPLLSSPLLPA